MRLKILLSVLFFAAPISFLEGSFEHAAATCHMTIPLSTETSGYKLITRTKSCDSSTNQEL